MLTRLFGIGRTSGATGKLGPTACPGVGYGSCPTMSTRTSWNGCLNARRTCSPAGRYLRPAAISARRNSPIAATCGATGSRAFAQPASTISCSCRAVTAREPSGTWQASPERLEPPKLLAKADRALYVRLDHALDRVRPERRVRPRPSRHAQGDLSGGDP